MTNCDDDIAIRGRFNILVYTDQVLSYRFPSLRDLSIFINAPPVVSNQKKAILLNN